MRSRKAVGTAVLAAFLLCAGVGWADEGSSSGVAVSYRYPTLTVQVTETSSLQAVLEAVCASAQSRCDIDPSTAGVSIEPLTLTGPWDQVLATLFEGTGINYASVAPTRAQRGRLIVQARRPGLEAAATTQATARGPSSRAVGTDAATDQVASTEMPTRQDSDPSQEPPAKDTSTDLSGADSQRQYMGQAGGGAPDPEMIRTSIESVRSLYEGMSTPRPPMPPGSSYVLPYPDDRGNPISVVVTNPTTITLPWPDSHGNPIVVTPVPGQKMEYPIPPTPR